MVQFTHPNKIIIIISNHFIHELDDISTKHMKLDNVFYHVIN
jgi:hypothetical protein